MRHASRLGREDWPPLPWVKWGPGPIHVGTAARNKGGSKGASEPEGAQRKIRGIYTEIRDAARFWSRRPATKLRPDGIQGYAASR